ncbi:MAG: hypothetical protein JOZ15_13740 [Acidobacteria bacterium]|nr:hypothetical protein [Acidobacteriota bacterium]
MSISTYILRRAATCAVLVLAAVHAAHAAAQTIALPAFDAGAFHTAFTFLGDGRVAAYTGDHVFVQDAVGAGSFSLIGSLPAEFRGASDPAFILAAPNGLFFVLGAGAGGAKFPDPRFNGNIYVLPITGGEARLAARIPLSLTATFRGSSELFVNQGLDSSSASSSSQVVRLDLATGSVQTVVADIPGESAGVGFDRAGNLYTGIGFLPGRTGEIRRFAREDVDDAVESAAPLDFAAGAFVAQSLTASPLLFDRRGDLVVGGGDSTPGGQDGFVAVIDPHTGALLRKIEPEAASGGQPFFFLAIDPRGCRLAANDFFDPTLTLFFVDLCG